MDSSDIVGTQYRVDRILRVLLDESVVFLEVRRLQEVGTRQELLRRLLSVLDLFLVLLDRRGGVDVLRTHRGGGRHPRDQGLLEWHQLEHLRVSEDTLCQGDRDVLFSGSWVALRYVHHGIFEIGNTV